jgi:hypothetical protein
MGPPASSRHGCAVHLRMRRRGGRLSFQIQLSNSPALQTRAIILAAGIPRELRPDFRWPLRHERFLLSLPPKKREQSAVGRGVETCSVEQATGSVEPASPYGAPLRRLLGSRLDLGAPLACPAQWP